jgi:hypothetical protein
LQSKLQVAAINGRVKVSPVIVVAEVQEEIVPPVPQLTSAPVIAANCGPTVICETLLEVGNKKGTVLAVGAALAGWMNQDVKVAVFGPMNPHVFAGIDGLIVLPTKDQIEGCTPSATVANPPVPE